MSAERNQKLEFRTKQFALRIIKMYSSLPKSTVAQVLGRQILRSGTSVGAQYREAMRAKSLADFVSKIEGSLQEIEETRYWLELLVESDTLSSNDVSPMRKEADELTAMLVASVRTAKRSRAR
jgi:four helix bundle protein